MRTSLATALVAGLLMTGAASAAPAAQAPKTAAHTAAKEKTATGTVKSLDAKTLVLKTTKGDMSFAIDSAAHKDTLATGATVTVHYRTEGKMMTATDVMVRTAAAKK